MRRIFGFALGILIGLGVVYAARRWLGLNSAAQSDKGMLTTPVAKAPTLPTSETASEPKPASTGRFTVRTNGPRPQIPTVTDAADAGGPVSDTTEVVGATTPKPVSDTTPTLKADMSEPVAAEETDASAANSRAEIETTQEIAVADERFTPGDARAYRG